MEPDATLQRIMQLRREKNAVILAHNYQNPEIQDIADYVGDSLGLSREAAKTQASVIVFCGVYFMAETAKILNPDKTVLLPDPHAGCPMADMITGEELRRFKAQHPGSVTVCYVNSTAEVKAESDISCTSSNAIRVVESIPKDKRILFVPDRHLGRFVKEKTGRDIVSWSGYCPTHARITADMVRLARADHPGALLLVHPECDWEVVKLSDRALSTGQMLDFVRTSDRNEFVIGTEKGILHTLRKENPGKTFHAMARDALCPNMKKITLAKVLRSLETGAGEVTVDPDIAARARKSIERMLGL